MKIGIKSLGVFALYLALYAWVFAVVMMFFGYYETMRIVNSFAVFLLALKLFYLDVANEFTGATMGVFSKDGEPVFYVVRKYRKWRIGYSVKIFKDKNAANEYWDKIEGKEVGWKKITINGNTFGE